MAKKNHGKNDILYFLSFSKSMAKKYGKKVWQRTKTKKQYKGNFINQYIFVFLYYQIPQKTNKKQTKNKQNKQNNETQKSKRTAENVLSVLSVPSGNQMQCKTCSK